MKIISKMLKVIMLLIESNIFCSSTLKDVQFLASLNTLKSRILLRARSPPLVKLLPFTQSYTFSIMHKITIVASKILNLSRKYSLKPKPNNFSNISKVNAQLNAQFNQSSNVVNYALEGYLSSVIKSELAVITNVQNNKNQELMQIL